MSSLDDEMRASAMAQQRQSNIAERQWENEVRRIMQEVLPAAADRMRQAEERALEAEQRTAELKV